MHVLPFAISVHKFVNSVGAEVGFASLIAVALLVILYFVAARETATLRDRLTQAHDRIDSLEGRVAQLIALQAARGQQPAQTRQPTVTPPPAIVGARPMGSAVASVRRVSPVGAGTPVPSAPMAVGAPALQSATKLIPDPLAKSPVVTPTVARAAEDTMLVAGGAATGAAAARSSAGGNAAPAPAPQPTVAPATVGATAAAAATSTGAPPRVQIRPEEPGAAPPRRTAPPSRASAANGGGARDNGGRDAGGGSRVLRRFVAVIAALVLVAAVVFGLMKLTSSGTNSTTSPGSHSAKPVDKTFHPEDVTVAVLNGTSVGGLAKDVSDALTNKGYRAGAVTNAAVQTQQSSLVSYIDAGSAKRRGENLVAAQHVAKDLGLKPSAVHPAGQAAIESCASGSGSGNSCHGQVIVTLGTDLASMANGSGTTT